jgi:hypothetical protein
MPMQWTAIKSDESGDRIEIENMAIYRNSVIMSRRDMNLRSGRGSTVQILI